MWAFATAGVASPALFEAVAVKAAPRLSEFTGQALANTVWAFAKAGVESPALFETVAAEAAPRLREFTGQALANTVWAFATMRVESPALFEAVAVEAASRLREFSAHDLAIVTWAFATAGVNSPALFEAVAVEAEPRLSEFNGQHLANTLWSFVCAAAYAHAGFFIQSLWTAAIQSCPSQLPLEAKVQLAQAHLATLQEAPHLKLVPPSVELEAALENALADVAATPSSLQQEVAKTLDALGHAHDYETLLPEGLSVDMRLRAEHRHVVIEVDGPRHYLRRLGSAGAGGSPRSTGGTRFKHRLLEAMGYHVVQVPHFEWPRGAAQRELFLRGKLGRT